MTKRITWRRLADRPFVQWLLFVVGILLLLLSPLVGAIPGPGGILVAAVGLALVLRTSIWAKRRYVEFKRWQPKAGRWTDRALRRPSVRRRDAIRETARNASGD